MKYCQVQKCNTYETKDRLRGPKGDKTYQTRRRSSFYYLGGNACSMNCQADWFEKFGDQAVNHFGRIHEPIKMTIDNAWIKDTDYNVTTHEFDIYYFRNKITSERRPLTQAQYNNDSTITQDGRLAI